MGIDSVPAEMKAVQVMEFNTPYKIHNIPTPKELQPHDLLIKVAVASLCHTDFMVAEGLMGTKLPCTASHEGTGTVAAAGSAVTKFKEGDRVMCGIFRDQCGVCPDCQGPENYKQYCPNRLGGIGVNVDGAFADYVIIDSRTAAKLPDNVTFETAAPLACAGSTVYRGVIQAGLKPGEWIGLVGSGGGLGHLGIQFAKALGLHVVGIDARDEGLALSKKIGCDVVIDARQGDDAVVEQVHKVTGARGVDATVNISDADSAATTACKITKMHGLVVQIAQPPNVSVPFAELVFRDIRIHGSLICSPQESQDMLEVVSKHGITVTTNPVNGLDKVPELVKLSESGKMEGKGVCIVDPKQIEEEKKLGATL